MNSDLEKIMLELGSYLKTCKENYEAYLRSKGQEGNDDYLLYDIAFLRDMWKRLINRSGTVTPEEEKRIKDNYKAMMLQDYINCRYCMYARLAGNLEYVGCAYFMDLMLKAQVDEDTFIKKVFSDPNGSAPREFGIGWAYPLKKPDESSLSCVAAGTVTESVMQNWWLCTLKTDLCGHFKFGLLKEKCEG